VFELIETPVARKVAPRLDLGSKMRLMARFVQDGLNTDTILESGIQAQVFRLNFEGAVMDAFGQLGNVDRQVTHRSTHSYEAQLPYYKQKQGLHLASGKFSVLCWIIGAFAAKPLQYNHNGEEMQELILRLLGPTAIPAPGTPQENAQRFTFPDGTVLQLLLSDDARLGGLIHQQVCLDVFYSFRQRVAEFFKILLVQKDLVLLIFLFANPLAFRNRYVVVFFRFRRFHVEEIRALPGPHPLREDLILVVVFQRASSR
jgi:hypothetical protein